MAKLIRDIVFPLWGLAGITYLVLTGAVTGLAALAIFGAAAGITALPVGLRVLESRKEES